MREWSLVVYYKNMKLLGSDGLFAMIFRVRQRKLPLILLSVVVFFAAVAVAVPVTVHADPNIPGTAHAVVNVVNDIAPAITYAIIEWLLPLMGRLLTLLISVLIWVSGYSDFVNSTAVVNGWVIVRDIANMFFIIVLLVVAFGTILGQEEYHYKKLLPKLLIMAVLVNFSRTIVGVIIDFAQVVMLTFVNGYSAAAGGNFAEALQIRKLLKFNDKSCDTLTGSGAASPSAILIGATLALGMVVVSIITITVILAVLLLRIVVLWFLTVMSPMAFLLGTVPEGQKYYTEWWEEFKNQVIVGPVLAFFLWLSLVTVGSGNAYLQITNSVGNERLNIKDTEFPVAACTDVAGASGITSFAIATLMLLAGTHMAQQMGGTIAGVAGQAKGLAQKGLKLFAAPVALGAHFGLQRGERALLDFATKPSTGLEALIRRPFKYLTPTGWKGFTQRGKGLLEESRTIAAAEAEEESNLLFTRGKRRLPLREAAEHGLVGKYAKDFSFLEKEAVMRKSAELMDLPGQEGERARAAILSVAAHGGFLDDIARLPEFRKKMVELGKRKYGYTDGTFYNKQLLNDLVWDYTTGAGVGSGKGVERAMENPAKYQFAARMISAIGEPGKANGHWEYVGHAKFDTKKGMYMPGDHEWLVEEARSEYNKRRDADRAQAAPHNFVALRETGDGEDDVDWRGTISEAEAVMRTALTPTLAKEARNLQGRHSEAVLGRDLKIGEKINGKEVKDIIGDEHMVEFVDGEKGVNKQNSEYLFGLYAKRANITLDEAAKQGKFRIVDKNGQVLKEVKYTGPPQHTDEEGTEGGGHGGGGGHTGGGGSSGGGGGGGEHKMTPSEALQASTAIQTAIKPQLQAMMRDIEKPGFLDGGSRYEEMRKLMKDLGRKIAELEGNFGVEIGSVMSKLAELERTLPGAGASSAAIRAALASHGKSENDVRKDLADVLAGISNEVKEAKEPKESKK